MPILEVLTFPNPILKQKSVSVENVTDELRKLSDDMLETMYASNGVGLAAPQVGRSIRLIVIDTRPRDEDGRVDTSQMTDLEKQVKYPLVLFNPEVIKKEGSTSSEEGCLSVPGFIEEVKRAEVIVCTAMDINGQKIEFETDGLLGICVQHEIDHLDGKLFIDRLSVVKSNLIKNRIRKHGYPSRDTDDHPL